MFLDKVTVLIIKACAAGVLLLVLGLWTYNKGGAKWQARYETAVAQHKLVLDDLAAKTARAARLAEEASKAAVIERQANDKRFNDAKRQADQAGHDLAAALRAGRERLQPWWDCPARPAQGDAAADADQTDAGRRADSAARVVAAADRDAAVIDWLWTGWQADRKAVIAAGCAMESAK